LYRYVPRELVERPKQGFGVPIHEWLRGPIKPWAEALLDENRLKDEGFFSPKPIRQKWTEHQTGNRNWQAQLWGILMFQAWLEQQKVQAEVDSNFDAETAQIANISSAASTQANAT
jgi:asparagine synthase (glutamine-hydrolysing)